MTFRKLPSLAARFAAIIVAALALPSPAAAQTYNLVTDWSDAANPNGPWSYCEGANPLPHVAWWQRILGGWTAAQPGWAKSEDAANRLPFWFRSNGTETFAHDFIAGDVLVHTTDPVNGQGSGAANVVWTSPICGTVDIAGAVWLGRDIGRGDVWTLRRNGELLTFGSIFDGDLYSRANPFNLALGSCGPQKLQDVIVTQGDEIRLEIVRTSAAGEFVGLRLAITATPGNCCKPCDANCDGSVNQFDIQPFVNTLSRASPPCGPCAADANGDGSVNQFDIQGFVDCLGCGS